MRKSLKYRVARLEAIEAVRYSFAGYFHAIDNNRIDVLLRDVFAPTCVVEIANYPPGSGLNRLLTTPEEIMATYGPIPADGHRHNPSNTTIVVNDDLTEAKVTSYFVTTIAWGNQGGIYEATFEPMKDGTWKATKWLVSSQWGWRLKDIPMELPAPYLYDPPSTGSHHDGMQPR